MRKLNIFIKTVAAVIVIIDGSEVGIFCYRHLSINLTNILIWSVVLIFYIKEIIWKDSIPEIEVRKYYTYVEAGIHVSFHSYFLYIWWLSGNYQTLFIELVPYWIFECIVRIVKFNERKQTTKNK